MTAPAGVPQSAIAAARERTRTAHDIWAMAGERSAAGTAARQSLVGVILDAATPAIRQSAFRLDETPEVRAALTAALIDACWWQEQHGTADAAERYRAVAAVLGLGVAEPGDDA